MKNSTNLLMLPLLILICSMLTGCGTVSKGLGHLAFLNEKVDQGKAAVASLKVKVEENREAVSEAHLKVETAVGHAVTEDNVKDTIKELVKQPDKWAILKDPYVITSLLALLFGVPIGVKKVGGAALKKLHVAGRAKANAPPPQNST